MKKQTTTKQPVQPIVEPAMEMALMWYSCDIFNKFDALGDEKAKIAADFASKWSLEYPLWLREKDKKEFPQRDIPGFGKKSSVYAMAMMAAWLVWAMRDKPETYLAAAGDNGFVKAAKQGYLMYKMGMK